MSEERYVGGAVCRGVAALLLRGLPCVSDSEPDPEQDLSFLNGFREFSILSVTLIFGDLLRSRRGDHSSRLSDRLAGALWVLLWLFVLA